MRVRLFKLVWRNYLGPRNLIMVTGWRSCILEEQLGGQRYHVIFMPIETWKEQRAGKRHEKRRR